MAKSYFFGQRPLRAVRVSGHSMSPNINWGDWIIFKRWHPGSLTATAGQRARIERRLLNKVVLIARLGPDGQRDHLQIKRVVKVDLLDGQNIGIWVEGDSPDQSTDSRHWGYLKPEEIIGRYLSRYHLG